MDGIVEGRMNAVMEWILRFFQDSYRVFGSINNKQHYGPIIKLSPYFLAKFGYIE